MSVPSAQNAGHTPRPTGICRRASNRPYRKEYLPWVLILAEVFDMPPVAAEQEIEASLVGPDEARLLEVAAGSPVLRHSRRALLYEVPKNFLTRESW